MSYITDNTASFSSLLHATRTSRRQQRAKEELSKAERRGIPARELAARRAGRVAHDDSDEFDPSTPDDDRFNSADAGIDDAEDGIPVWLRPKSRRALLMECRDRSRSAWLYFPHIELLFLLFAFEGAVASQLGALRDGGCPWVVYMACTALVSCACAGETVPCFGSFHSLPEGMAFVFKGVPRFGRNDQANFDSQRVTCGIFAAERRSSNSRRTSARALTPRSCTRSC